MVNLLLTLFGGNQGKNPATQGPQGIQGAIGPQGPKGDTGPKGDVGPQGPKGDSATNRKIAASFAEMSARNQNENDFFKVFEDQLGNLSDEYSLGGNIEHSFFTEKSKLEDDLNHLRLVVVDSNEKIVKQLPQSEVAKVITGKRLVPGSQYYGLDIQMKKSFMDEHLAGSSNKIIMLFVGDRRETVLKEIDITELLLIKVANLENKIAQLDRFDNNSNYRPSNGPAFYTPNNLDPNS